MGEVIFKIVIMETCHKIQLEMYMQRKIFNPKLLAKRNKDNYLEKTDYNSSVMVIQIFREGQEKMLLITKGK